MRDLSADYSDARLSLGSSKSGNSNNSYNGREGNTTKSGLTK